MTHQEKTFGEMDRELTEEFYGLQKFNDFLESHPGLLLKDIQSSYLRVLGEKDFESHKFSYSELDFAVKQVVEESGVAVNKILEFIELKYQDKVKLITELLIKNLPFVEGMLDPIIINYMLDKKKGDFQIGIPKYGVMDIKYDFTHQNFLYALDLLKKNIETELVRLAGEEKSA